MKIKKVYNQNDFDFMNWHDICVRGIFFNESESKLNLFIDYIFEWKEINSNEIKYKQLQSPAILTFKDVNNLEINLLWKNWALQLFIFEIERKKSKKSKSRILYNYDIIFSTPKDGRIIIYDIEQFEMVILGEKQIYEDEESYKKYWKEYLSKNIYFQI